MVTARATTLEKLVWHCEMVVRAGWRRAGCTERAETVYVDGEGARHGYCATHRAEGAKQAAWQRWTAQAGDERRAGALTPGGRT